MFGNAGANPPTDAGDPPDGSAGTAADGRDPIPAESGISSANSESVGRWLDQLPERSWDQSPGE